jgi:hypothetical protein
LTKRSRKLPDIVLSWETSLIIVFLGYYQGKLPDIVLSWETSLIIVFLGHYQGKLPDNQWLYFSAKQTRCECVRSDAAVFLRNKKPYERSRAEALKLG